MENIMKEICENYQKRLFHIAFSITRDHYLAEDVVQETLIKGYKHLHTVEDKEKLGAWLSSIATRTAIDFLRKEKRLKGNVDGYAELEQLNLSHSQSVEGIAEASFLQAEIAGFIQSLAPDQRKLFLLKINDGMKEKEIAEMLNLNPNTVKTRIYRVRKQLKEKLTEFDIA